MKTGSFCASSMCSEQMALCLRRLQPGSPGEWAPAAAALQGALPQRLRQQAAPALAAVTAALLRTPAGVTWKREAAEQHRAAAEAAADTAMRELLHVRD